MDRVGIVHRGADSGRRQFCPQSLTVINLNDEKMVHGFRARAVWGQSDREVSKAPSVTRCQRLSTCVSCIEVEQFHSQDCRLQFV